MKIKKADKKYLEKAKLLTDEESERLLSRMGSKLRRRQDKDKVSNLEAMAIQLEVEDAQLQEWREKMAAIKQNAKT
jgi:N-acyl-L-homoserine lactone synthetase